MAATNVLRPVARTANPAVSPTGVAARPAVPTGGVRPAPNPAVNGAARPTAGGLPIYPFRTLPPQQLTRVTGLFFGYSGAGKTHLFRSIVNVPELLPALYVVCDEGQVSLIDLIDNVQLVGTQVRTFPELLTLFSFLSTDKHFKTVIVDGLTELYRNLFMTAVKTRLQKAGKTLNELDTSRNDFGEARTRMLEFVSSFTLQLPHNVFMTCLAADSSDEATGQIQTEPNVSGKLSTELPGYFNISGYLASAAPTAAEKSAAKQAGLPEPKIKRKMYLNQTTRIMHCRNRGGKLPDVLEDPTIEKLYRAYIPAGGSADPTPVTSVGVVRVSSFDGDYVATTGDEGEIGHEVSDLIETGVEN